MGNPGRPRGTYRKHVTPAQYAMLTRLRRLESDLRRLERERDALTVRCWQAQIPASQIAKALSQAESNVRGKIKRWRARGWDTKDGRYVHIRV